MDEDLILALQKAITWLEEHGYQYALIGGIANQWWGVPRLTHDVDIKVLVPDLDYAAVREALRADFPGRGRPHAPRNRLIVDAIIEDATVDFLLTIPGYDDLGLHGPSWPTIRALTELDIGVHDATHGHFHCFAGREHLRLGGFSHVMSDEQIR